MVFVDNYFFILFVGKVGGFIVFIFDVMVVVFFCFMWVMFCVFGLFNFCYGVMGSSSNSIVVGLVLFLFLLVFLYF